jgi:hypothetical protein
MVKIKFTATVPVVQYGNIQPEIEVKAKTIEEASSIAETYIKTIWNRYVENGKQLSVGNIERLQAWLGGEIDYDSDKHQYSWERVPYMNASRYAESLKAPFDGQIIAEKMAAKIDGKPEKILAMWNLKGQASRDFGSAIHAGLQLREQYRELSESLDKTYHIHDNPIIKEAVDAFFKDHDSEEALNEILVVDHAAKRAGTIDRLLVTGKNKCRVQDFKTGATVKDIKTYWIQLKFYSEMLENLGWTVEGLDIFHYENNGKWKTYTYEEES